MNEWLVIWSWNIRDLFAILNKHIPSFEGSYLFIYSLYLCKLILTCLKSFESCDKWFHIGLFYRVGVCYIMQNKLEMICLFQKHPHVIFEAKTRTNKGCGNHGNLEWGRLPRTRTTNTHLSGLTATNQGGRFRRDVREATKYIETAMVIDKAMVRIYLLTTKYQFTNINIFFKINASFKLPKNWIFVLVKE